MSQHDYVIENAPGGPVRTDINLALQAIMSTNRGDAEPTAKAIGQLWLQTAATAGAAWPNGRLWLRNAANTGWVDLPTPPVMNGGQIAFPSTQLPSSDPYTLDDYREATWTPTLRFGGVTTGFSYNRQEGRAIKVGKRVDWWCGIKLAAKGSGTGVFTMAGLPWTAQANTPVTNPTYYSGSVGYAAGMVGTSGAIGIIVPANGTVVNFYHSIGVTPVQLTEAMVGGALQLELSGTYEAVN